jgi:nitroimidazol reductase NimA-like FMN-containing flavoprotein (pyridoxamine 5'-phosphate oxidase superfamily)
MDGEGLEVLIAEECLELLAESGLGRIAVTIGAVPAIFPVHYRLIDGQIVFRTGSGTNLHTASANTVVAFEVDEVHPSWNEGWSVLAVGVAREVRDNVAIASVLEQAPKLWDATRGAHVFSIVPAFLSGRRFVSAA